MLYGLKIIKEGDAFRVYALEFGDSYDVPPFLLKLSLFNIRCYKRPFTFRFL